VAAVLPSGLVGPSLDGRHGDHVAGLPSFRAALEALDHAGTSYDAGGLVAASLGASYLRS